MLDPNRKLNRVIPCDTSSRFFQVGCDSKAPGWNLAFQRKSRFVFDQPIPGGTDGWRLSDGGFVIPLSADRSFWWWGDTVSSFTGLVDGLRNPILHFLLGSTVAISGIDPEDPIRFFARHPVTGQPLDISTGDGVETGLVPFAASGAWVPTTHEHDAVLDPVTNEYRDPQTRTWLWGAGGINIGGTLYLLYRLQGCRSISDPLWVEGDPCNFGLNAYELRQSYIFAIGNTNDPDVRNWTLDYVGVKPLRNRSGAWTGVAWSQFHDDGRFVYAFGLELVTPQVKDAPPEFKGDLYAARAPREQFSNYQSWEFLHKDGVWRLHDDSVEKLKPIANNVAGEFTIHRVTLSCPFETRWLLVHTEFFSNSPWPFGNNGILRISADDSFLTFPNDEGEFFWINIRDVEPNLTESELVNFGTYPRGFGAYPSLSDLPASTSLGPQLRLLVGYTPFALLAGSIYGDPRCGDHGGPCGSRRFTVLDLTEIWPRLEPRLGALDPCGIDFDPCAFSKNPPWTCVPARTDRVMSSRFDVVI